ncbi:MAG: hypothetical protein KGJ10_07105 [Acidobacteriota bacterium]|nr:hypothetical protein [Acidobacteriota bacterium]
MDSRTGASAEIKLSEDECVTLVMLATRGRVIYSSRGVPSARPTQISLINGCILFLGDGDDAILEAARRHDVLSIQVDDATVEAPTWSVTVTGRCAFADPELAPASLRNTSNPDAAVLALPLTLISGRRKTI